MNKHVLTIIFMFFCVFGACLAGPQPSFDIEKLNIKVGMKRSILERNIKKYVELNSNYSEQYPTESPTNATYIINTINLHVTYKDGAPAPYTKNKDGSISHLLPIEQTVDSWSIDE